MPLEINVNLSLHYGVSHFFEDTEILLFLCRRIPHPINLWKGPGAKNSIPKVYEYFLAFQEKMF